MIRFLSKFKWWQVFAIKITAYRILYGPSLTPSYLYSKGWILEDGFFVEPNVKKRDKVWIQFEHHYYRVFHGENRTYIALESSIAWFENYYTLIHGDNGRYNIASL